MFNPPLATAGEWVTALQEKHHSAFALEFAFIYDGPASRFGDEMLRLHRVIEPFQIGARSRLARNLVSSPIDSGISGTLDSICSKVLMPSKLGATLERFQLADRFNLSGG